MRIVLGITYDGKDFCGWQIQPNGRTVQECIEKAIFKLTGEQVSVTGSGRTDSGVHALCQVAHFDTQSTIPPEKFAPALNGILESDVQILFSMQAPNDFHARFGAKKKTYIYTFYQSEVKLPLCEPYAQRIDSVDLKKMQAGAKFIEGTHDFKCFLAANSSVKDTVRTVYSCKVKKTANKITIEICGNGFLYNMVRTVAGTLLAVGEEKITPEQIKNIIDSKNRKNAGKTMPAKGLMLKNVCYKSIKMPKIY